MSSFSSLEPPGSDPVLHYASPPINNVQTLGAGHAASTAADAAVTASRKRKRAIPPVISAQDCTEMMKKKVIDIWFDSEAPCHKNYKNAVANLSQFYHSKAIAFQGPSQYHTDIRWSGAASPSDPRSTIFNGDCDTQATGTGKAKTASGGGAHGCSFCEAHFPSPSTLAIHEQTHAGEEPQRSPMVVLVPRAVRPKDQRSPESERAEQKQQLQQQQHPELHRQEALQVLDTPRRLSDKTNLLRHKRTDTGDELYGCLICPMQFARKADVAPHERTHDAAMMYHTGKMPVFSPTPQQQSHGNPMVPHAVRPKDQRSPESERAEQKQQQHPQDARQVLAVPQRLSDKTNLLRHMRTDTSDELYGCLMCPMQFSRKADVAPHERTHSETVVVHRTGKTPAFSSAPRQQSYGCSMCPKRFRQKGNVAPHERTHTGENSKLHGCSMCPMRFARKGDVAAHKRSHTGEKPYGCSMCPKRFSQKSNVTAHERTHTGEKPYGCSMCPQRFTQKSNVAPHERRRHKREQPHLSEVVMAPSLAALVAAAEATLGAMI